MSTTKVRGVAPGVTSAGIVFAVCDVAFFGCTSFPSAPVGVDPTTHRFTASAPDDLTGSWTVTLRWVKGDLAVDLLQRMAQLVVQPGSARVGRTGRTAGRSVAVSVRRGQDVALANPTTRSDASFSALVKRGGSPMKVRKGDLVSSSIAGDAVMTVPATSIELVPGGVVGRCFKNRPVTMLVFNAAGGIEDWELTTSEADGTWDADTQLLAGWTADAYCGNANGDAIKLHLLAN